MYNPLLLESLRLEARRIFVNGLRLDCAIGAYDHERGRLQPVVFNCDVWVKAVPTEDRLENVLNYDCIVETIRSIALSGHIDLQETLVERIADALAELEGVLLVRVDSRKTGAYPDVNAVGVEVWRPSPSFTC